jgi:hypothetical protein
MVGTGLDEAGGFTGLHFAAGRAVSHSLTIDNVVNGFLLSPPYPALTSSCYELGMLY